jgi:hypothetical protein
MVELSWMYKFQGIPWRVSLELCLAVLLRGWSVIWEPGHLGRKRTRDHTMEGASLGSCLFAEGGGRKNGESGRQRYSGIRLVVRRTTPRVRGCERNVVWRIQERRVLGRAIIG